MISPKELDWTLTKEDKHYFDPFRQKTKPLPIIIRLEGDWAICLSQSCQISNMKNGSSWLLIRNIIAGVRCSIDAIFKGLSINMISTTHLENEDENKDKTKEMIQLGTDPWIKHLNTIWDICFEQREPPTEDKMVQINQRNEANPKPIFIRKSL